MLELEAPQYAHLEVADLLAGPQLDPEVGGDNSGA